MDLFRWNRKKYSFYFLLRLTFVFFSFLQNVKGTTFEKGQELFFANCLVCHRDGKNLIIPEKNLKKDSLEANGMNNLNAISYQVRNGKNGMPAFGSRLLETEIEEVSFYVLKQSLLNFPEK